MQETQQAILRSNIKKVIEISVIVCFILLIGVLAMQHIHFSQTTTKKARGTLTAGVNRHFSEVLKGNKVQNTTLRAGACKHFQTILKEEKTKNQAKVQKLEIETVTSCVAGTENYEVTDETETEENAEVEDETETKETADEEEAEPSILYKSIEEVKISRDMDLTQTTQLSKEDFCELLANFKYDYEGFYRQNAGLIWDLSQEYQVNEIFLCGVFGLESYYGSDDRHVNTHNYGSIMNKHGELVRYSSDSEGIEANFKLFKNCYLNPEGKYYKGVTIDSIGDTYCPPTPECPSWAEKVYSCMKIFLEQ